MRLIEQPSELKFAYEDGADVADALEAVATKVYRADGVDFTPAAKRQLAELRENGFGTCRCAWPRRSTALATTPVPWALPRTSALRPASEGFRRSTLRSNWKCSTTPRRRRSAAENIDVNNDDNITGLF